MFRYKFSYSKQDTAVYMSHLDLVRTLGRALRRANIPVAHSQGFNPQPRLSFAAPLPVGTAGLEELGELHTTAPISQDCFLTGLNAALPPGLQLLQVWTLPPKAPALMATVEKAGYQVQLTVPISQATDMQLQLNLFLAQEQINITRRDKKGRLKTRDIKPGIEDIQITAQEQYADSDQKEELNQLTLTMQLKTGSVINVRPEEVISAFFAHTGGTAPHRVQITRTKLITS